MAVYEEGDTRPTFLPRSNSLKPVQYRTIVSSGHLDTQGSRDEAKVEGSEVGFLVPWCRVQGQQPVDLRLLGNGGNVVLLGHLEDFVDDS